MSTNTPDPVVATPPPSADDRPTVLSEKLVLHKARCASLSAVRNLNLWGSGLTDVSLVSSLSNAEVISLSVNKVSSLRPFASCARLQELYLRKNSVANLAELVYLRNLKKLSVLWLADNPCAEGETYRAAVLRLLPRLTKLDNVDVSDDERRAAENAPLPAGVVAALEADEAGCVPTQGSGAQGAEAAAKPPAPVARKASVTKTSTTPPASSNVLYAVMALLGELDEQALAIVREDVEARLAGTAQ